MSRQQYGAIYDLISEGPIEGLVNSSASVYYNDTPIAGSSSLDSYGAKLFTGSVSGTTLTGPSGTFSSDLVGRFVAIPKAAKSSTLASGVSAGATTITVSDAIILSTYVNAFADSTNPRFIRIVGAGPDGAEYGGRIVERVSDTEAVISPAISTAVSSGANVFIDHVTGIQSVANSTNATLTVTANNAVTDVQVQLYAAGPNTAVGKANFRDASVHFRAGEREQRSAGIYGAPSDSRIYAPGTDLSWHSDFGGTASDTIIDPLSASGLNFSNEKAQEITKVKLSLEFPAGLMIIQKDGDLKTGFAEFQVLVAYKKTSSSTEQEVLVQGRSSPPSWPTGTERITGYDSKYHPNTSNAPILVVTGRTRGSFIREIEVDLTPFQPFYSWRIKLKRVTPDVSDDFVGTSKGDQGYNFQGLTKLKTVQAETNNKFSYPLSAYALVTFSAQDFSSPPTRGYHIRGKQIKVPTNYITREEINSSAPNTVEAKYTRNKTTGADTGSYVTWDGTFRGDKSLAATNVNYKLVYTNNPAWIFYDILTNKEYGLGEWVSESDVDVYALYQIARYCDEMVPNGQGSLEPRFTCNVYFQSKQEAYKVLKDLASSFRGMMYWIDGQISPVQDRPKEPVYTFTQGNVIDGMFTYETTGSRARVNQVNVTWNNPEELYRQSILTVDDFDSIVEDERIVSKDIVAFGATSESQALRVGRWHLLTDQLETELVKFQTSINAGFLRPGDIINVQDAKADAIEFSGRVSSSSTTTSINLDRSVTLQSGETYNLYLLYPQPGCYLQQDSATINSVSLSRGDLILKDASNTDITTAEAAANLVDDSGNKVFTSFNKNTRLEKQQISTGAGATTSVTVSSAFSAAPDSEVIWAVSNVNEYQRTDAVVRYRIMGIEEDQVNLYSIIASKYVYEKFDELEKNYAKYVEPYKPNPTLDALVPAPTNLRVEVVPSATVDTLGGASGLDVVLSWNEPLESFTDSGGTTTNTKYRFIDSYDVQHDVNSAGMADDYETISAGAGTTSITLRGVSVGTHTFRVRTRNFDGQTSEYVEITQDISPTQQVALGYNRASKVVQGGSFNSVITFSSGVVTIPTTTYKFTTTSSQELEFTDADPANSATHTQSFTAMANSTTAYWYFDFSSSSDPWKAMLLHTDSSVTDSLGNSFNYTYWKELGATNNGLTLASGTATVAAGSATITGSGTSFTSDYAAGDLIKLSNDNTYSESATTEYLEVSRVVSNTELHTRTNATKSHTGAYIYKQTFKPDFGKDNIAAAITKTAGAYTIAYFAAKRGDLADAGNLVSGNIDGARIAANTIDGVMIASNSIGTVQLSANAIDSTNIQANSISNVEIASGTIQAANIEANTITNAQIAAGTIDTAQIAADAITNAKIEANAVDTAQIAASAVNTLQIAANAITNSEIEAGAVDTLQIAANAITNAEIAGNAVTNASILGNTITAAEISANSIGSTQISSGGVLNANIQANAIDSTSIAANSVNTVIIAADGVRTDNILDDAINNAKIATNAVNSDSIAANAVGNAEVAGNAISSASIQANAIGSAEIAANAVGAAAIVANSIGAAAIAANSIGAVAIAAGAIGALQIAANAIGAAKIAGNAIGSAEIAANAIGSAEISGGAIGTAEIAGSAITTAKIGADQITNAKIAAGAVDTAEIAADAITNAKIAAGAVDTLEIAADAITNAKIAAGAVDTLEIAADAITNAKIAAGAVDTLEIAANAITSAKIAAGQIGEAEIAANAITSAKIKANSIDSAELVSGSIDAIHIAANAITSAKIGAGQIGEAEIAANAITSAKIKANSIDSAELVSGSIDAIHIAANAITSAKIGAGQIGQSEIAANSIDNVRISANSINNVSIITGGVETASVAARAITDVTRSSMASNRIYRSYFDTLASISSQTFDSGDIAAVLFSAVSWPEVSGAPYLALRVSIYEGATLRSTTYLVGGATYNTNVDAFMSQAVWTSSLQYDIPSSNTNWEFRLEARTNTTGNLTNRYFKSGVTYIQVTRLKR